MNPKMEEWILKAIADMEKRIMSGENVPFVERYKPYQQLYNYQMYQLIALLQKLNGQ